MQDNTFHSVVMFPRAPFGSNNFLDFPCFEEYSFLSNAPQLRFA